MKKIFKYTATKMKYNIKQKKEAHAINELPLDKNPLLITECDKENYLLLIEIVKKYNRLSSRVIDDITYPDYGKCKKQIAFYRSKKLREWIIAKTPKLNDNTFQYSLLTRINWIFNGRTEFPTCPVCKRTYGIHQNISAKGRGYYGFCSIKCVNNSEETRDKIKQTNEIRYGDPNYNNRELSKKTTREHYGVDNIFKAREFIEKQKKILHENKETRMQHFKENCINKYGVEHPMKLKEVADKCMKNRSPQSCFKWFSARYYYDGVKFDSSYELIFYIYLKDNQISFEYHPKTYFIYKDSNKKGHRYYPDFKIGNDIIEIKPAKCFDKDGNYRSIWRKKQKYVEENIDYFKGKCMKDNHIKIMTENELMAAFEYFSSIYPKDFISKCKIRKSKISL